MSKATISSLTQWLPRLAFPLLLLGISLSVVCLLFMLVPLDPALAWQRAAIDSGEYWRLISGNFLHTNFWHFLMNIAGFWVIVAIHHFHYSWRGLALLLLCLALAEGLGLWWFYPALSGYVGLSGLLHGLFSFGAVLDIAKGLRSGWLLLAGVLLKVGHETLYGASDGVANLINARVATESHLVGALSGVALGLIYLTVTKLRHQSA